MVVGRTVVLNQGAPKLSAALSDLGFAVRPLDFSEFIKAGGSAKCLTLRLDGEEAAGWKRLEAFGRPGSKLKDRNRSVRVLIDSSRGLHAVPGQVIARIKISIAVIAIVLVGVEIAGGPRYLHASGPRAVVGHLGVIFVLALDQTIRADQTRRPQTWHEPIDIIEEQRPE